MIKITKSERNALVNMGVKIGENGISRTYTKHKTYYLAELPRNMQKLEKLRKERLIERCE